LANIGTVTAMRGEAFAQRSGNIQKTLKMGSHVQRGDQIVTKANSRVQILLNDDTVITVGSNTTFKFDSYFFDGSEKSKVEMHVVKGFFRSLTGQIGKIAPKSFKVKTDLATLGIRGTDFSILILKNKKEFYRCYAGSIVVTYKNQLQHAIMAGENYLLSETKENVQVLESITQMQDLNIEEIDSLINQGKLFDEHALQGELCN